MSATSSSPDSAARVIALVSAAHFFSHFYMLLLPPLFPLIRDDFQIGFTELGFALTVYSLSTALTQVPMGFLVDRFGARGLLIAGLMAESIAIIMIGLFPSYPMLLALMALAGLGNAVFHPADYAILNARVAAGRIGRAFSIHTFSGLLGAAIAPPLVVVLASYFDWRIALIVCGVGGGVLGMLLAFNMGALRDISTAGPTAHSANTNTKAGIRVLFTAPLLLAMLFFVGLAMFGRGINSFGISALEMAHPGSLSQVAVVLSAFLFASPIGVLLGGQIADRLTRHDIYVTACLLVFALCAFAIAAFAPPLVVTGVLFAIAGLATGSVAPSRDMMVRALTPPGQSGKVFGFVSTGYNIGGVIAPPLFGLILDHASAGMVFWAVGVFALLTVFTVLLTGQSTRNR
jgi:FSR family fosmidomycin resistance protein-like MFS transporter